MNFLVTNEAQLQFGTDALTDAEGGYEITFTEEDFRRGELLRRGKARFDLFVTEGCGDSYLQALQLRVRETNRQLIDKGSGTPLCRQPEL
jgi:hypothetical protein